MPREAGCLSRQRRAIQDLLLIRAPQYLSNFVRAGAEWSTHACNSLNKTGYESFTFLQIPIYVRVILGAWGRANFLCVDLSLTDDSYRTGDLVQARGSRSMVKILAYKSYRASENDDRY